jgi:hypothetical protein
MKWLTRFRDWWQAPIREEIRGFRKEFAAREAQLQHIQDYTNYDLSALMTDPQFYGRHGIPPCA